MQQNLFSVGQSKHYKGTEQKSRINEINESKLYSYIATKNFAYDERYVSLIRYQLVEKNTFE